MPVLLALKSDVVLATQLVARQRALRLAVLLALMIVAISLLERGGSERSSADPTIVLLVGGILGAVAGARPLAPGAPLASAYWAAAPWWLVPVARLTGILLVILPVGAVGVVALSGGTDGRQIARVWVVTVVYSASVTSVMLMLTPALGSSAASAIGFLTAWMGTVPPSVIDSLLGRWPSVNSLAVTLWNSLPLNWRAARWVTDGNWSDLMILIGWLWAGIAGSAWLISARYRSNKPQARVVA